jgi:hypothetical protein
MPDKRTDFTIVRILDEFSVVIDGGYNHGINKGDIFQIYSIGEPIYRPEQNDLFIGTLDIVKSNIIAVDVQPGLTICRNEQTSSNMKFSDEFAKGLAPFVAALAPVARPLRVDPTEIEPRNLSDEPIKLGDKVRKLPYRITSHP